MEVVKQRDLKDCGVCSLQSIIKFYGGYVSLEKLRIDTYTTREGTTAYNLISAAKKYGFDSYGIKISAKDLLKENIVLPAIAHIKLDNGLMHFVVVYKISKNKITIMDPAKGKVVLRTNDFLKIWTNILIIFHPRHKILKFNNEKKLSELFISILKNQKVLVLKLFWVSICLTLLSIIANYYFKVGLNAITNNVFTKTLSYIIILFAIITFFKIIFGYLRNYFGSHLNKNIDIHIFSDFITHIFNLPSNIIQSRTTGEVITRVNELNDLKQLFSELFVTLFLDSILAFASMILLIFISKELFLILCISLILYILIGLLFNSITYKKIMQTIEAETEFNTTLIENLNMFDSIKNLNTTKSNLNKIEASLMYFIKNNFFLSNFLNKHMFLKNFINEITIFLINTTGFLLIKGGSLKTVDLITFNSLMAFFISPVKNTVDMLPKYNYLKASFYKINDFLSNEVENMNEDHETLNNPSIRFENVTFTYNSYKSVLKNLNFEIGAREHVFLKGDSGTGKSTICKLLYRELMNNHGNILIGEVSINDYSLSTIRNSILYVSQEENIYTDTIRNNIIFNRDIKEEELRRVSKICKLDSILEKRPLRYESLITNDISNISGGEKERIILARALLKDAEIIILDEALSEVDYNLETEIIKNIRKNYKDKTIIYISHKDHANQFDRTINLRSIYE